MWETKENTEKYKPFTITRIKTYNIEDLEVVKPFNLIDIYEKRPCHGEFLELLKENTAVKSNWLDIRDVEQYPPLMRNLSWLIDKGFLQEKKITKLVPGMRLILISDGDKYLVTKKGIFNMKSGNDLIFNKVKTLEELNNKTYLKYKVIKDPSTTNL